MDVDKDEEKDDMTKRTLELSSSFWRMVYCRIPVLKLNMYTKQKTIFICL